MPRSQHLQRRIERTLQSLSALHDEGMLPPALEPLLALAPPRGAQVEVTVRESEGAPPNGRDAGLDEVRITFRGQASRSRDSRDERDTYVRREPRDARDYREPRDSRDAQPPRDPMPALIEILAEAENRPQLRFIALKFLRDRLLPETHHAWARSPQSCQAVIGEAIDRGILLTSKTPNPRNPDFPVTAVKLNRDDPTVRKLVGAAPLRAAAAPVEVEAEGEAEAAS